MTGNRLTTTVADAIALLNRIQPGHGPYARDLGDSDFDQDEWLRRRDDVVASLREIEETT